jgi:hypothetical protein
MTLIALRNLHRPQTPQLPTPDRWFERSLLSTSSRATIYAPSGPSILNASPKTPWVDEEVAESRDFSGSLRPELIHFPVTMTGIVAGLTRDPKPRGSHADSARRPSPR